MRRKGQEGHSKGNLVNKGRLEGRRNGNMRGRGFGSILLVFLWKTANTEFTKCVQSGPRIFSKCKGFGPSPMSSELWMGEREDKS